VPHLSRHAGAFADRFFRRPSADMRIAGITGTNGKTTVAYLLAQASELVGRRGWYIGTLGHGRANVLTGAELTTPMRYRCSVTWPRLATPVRRQSGSRSHPTRSTRTVSRPCASTPRYSRT
jgi:hypothetical protein